MRTSYTFFATHASTVAAAIAVLAVGAVAWPYTVDDAFIIARYATQLVAGHGYGMNASQPSDGVTGPLWLVPEVLASALGFDPAGCAKLLGLACAVLATALLISRLRRRSGGRSAAAVAAFVLSLSPSLGTWAVAGLETGAATLLATIAALAATRRPRPQSRALGLAVAGLAWLRPELSFFAAVLLVWTMIRAPRAGMWAAGTAAIGAACVMVFRLVCFDHLLPLSYFAKASTLGFGLRHCAQAVLLATSGFGVWLVALGVRHGRPDDRAVAAALLAHLVAMVLAGGDWMPGYRLLVPVLPVYSALAGVGVVRALGRRPWLAAALVLLTCSVPALDLATRIADLRTTETSRQRLAPFAKWLGKHTHLVALVDIGYLGFASGVAVVDLGGLTDARIAHMPGGHLGKRIDEGYLRERNPDAIVLHSATSPHVDADGRLLSFDGFEVEQRIAALPFVRDKYRVTRVVHYAPAYDYVVLQAIGDHQGLPR
jgi:hypothetical protein